MFDNSTYTNDPKTGKRVDQYKKEKTPYRDPNAFFDSPLIGGFFDNDFFGGFYDNYNPLTYFKHDDRNYTAITSTATTPTNTIPTTAIRTKKKIWINSEAG